MIHDTRTPAEKERIAKIAVYELLPEDCSFISWGDLRRKANQAPRSRPSSATLAKHLAKFVEVGEVIREEREIEKNVKRRGPTPKIFYRRATGSEKTLFRMIPKKKKKWNEKQERIWNELILDFSLFVRHFGYVIDGACERKTVEEAEKYLDLMLDLRLHRHVHDLAKLCYKHRNVKYDDIRILNYVIDKFLIEAEETAEKWLTSHCPDWAKPYIKYVPAALLASILASNEKDEAQKQIENFIRETQGRPILEL